MIGRVIEGRFTGAIVNKLPDKNTLYIQTEEGTKIELSKKNVISIDDVTDQFPSYGRKVMMVMWEDFETSILQLGGVKQKKPGDLCEAPPPADIPTPKKVRQTPSKTSAGVRPKRKKISLLIMILLLFVVIAIAVILFLTGKSLTAPQPEGQVHEHSWQEASCSTPQTCTGCEATQGSPLGHECGEWVITEDGTISAPGTRVRYCVRCNEVVEQGAFYQPVYQDGLYEFTASEFSVRLKNILQSRDGNFDVTITSASTDAINVTISVNYKPAALLFFLNNNETVGGNENSVITATSIMIAVITDDTYQRDVILPSIVECCSNGIQPDAAAVVADGFVSGGKHLHDGLSFVWKKYQGYDSVTVTPTSEQITFQDPEQDQASVKLPVSAVSSEGITWTKDESILELYDENGFLIDGNEFMARFAYALLDMPDIDENLTQLSFKYDTWDYIDITRRKYESTAGQYSSAVALSFKGNDALNVPLTCVSVRVDETMLMNNYTDYRRTILNIMGTLPYTIDPEMESVDEGRELIVSMLEAASESEGGLLDRQKLPSQKTVNGVIYTLQVIESDIFFTASVVDCVLVPRQIAIEDFVVDGTNIIQDIYNHFGSSGGFYYVYFDPQTDPDKGQVLCTARNIRLGDPMESVINAYGNGEVKKFNPNNNTHASDVGTKLKTIMGVQCVSYIDYISEEGYKITFYFDSENTVSWVIFDTNGIRR